MRHFFENMKTEELYTLFTKSAGISTDSRTIEKNQIFFALWGENYNGNKFAAEAIEKGASWAVIDDPALETDKTILVDDCLFELQALATHHRKELKASAIAITGTNGKTTTKELVSAVLARKYRTHYTRGNLNNQIGVPLTILSAPEDTEMMIIEMGASHIGEIRTLCLISKPDYGIITNIGTAHIEGFGTLDGVIKSKTELYEYLRKVNGIALYNDRDPILTERIYKLVNRAVPFSDPTGIGLIVEPEPSDMKLNLTARYHHKVYRISTNMFGNYNIENVRSAIATGLFLGVEMEDIVEAIEKYQPANNRSQVKVTKNNTLICDSYNANPSSMRLVIESFAGIRAEKKMCILGDMLELGEKTEEEHIKVLNLLHQHNIKDVFLVGDNFKKVSAGFKFRSFASINKLKDFLKAEPLKGNYILIKGSRGMTLEKIFNLL